ncbi:MAG: hypothetical protein MPN21_25670 [Thermoanaerobaculia bacterium]|nr:hypothetical protein [Thermoanaerobaculia bacterium]
MNAPKIRQATGLFILSYLGFLTHLGLETLLLIFGESSMEPEEWQSLVEYMSRRLLKNSSQPRIG